LVKEETKGIIGEVRVSVYTLQKCFESVIPVEELKFIQQQCFGCVLHEL
jgi:hypothetical protein